MNTIRQSARRWFSAYLMAAALVGLGCGAASAQSVESDAVKEKLSTKVHLRLGKTTLARVAAALSEQTGLKFEPAYYLADRDMIAQMDGVSARAVLNALAELNDWKWREMPDHAISIARHLLRPPQVPVAIPRIIQSAMPKDTRAFLTIATPSEDLAVYANPLLADWSAASSKQRKAAVFMRDTQGDLFGSLPPDSVKGDPIPFDKLSDPQQRNLAAQFAFQLIFSLDQYLLSDFRPFVYDPAAARLEIFQNRFRIGNHFGKDGWTGVTTDIAP